MPSDLRAPKAPRRATILVVDDEEQLRRALRSILETRGHTVVAAPDADAALASTLDATPELVILDLALPGLDGFGLLERLRSWLDVPILVLSVKSEEADKVRALELGADDYLTKPFSAAELVARVDALLRRAAEGPQPAAVIEVGDMLIDIARRRVTRSGEDVALTRTEFDILAWLATNADRVVTSRMLFERVWGEEYLGDAKTLRVHISNLRKKVEPHPSVPRHILTEPGVGFVFSTR
jgi:two-component system KDP operon response regulator KdpE